MAKKVNTDGTKKGAPQRAKEASAAKKTSKPIPLLDAKPYEKPTVPKYVENGKLKPVENEKIRKHYLDRISKKV